MRPAVVRNQKDWQGRIIQVRPDAQAGWHRNVAEGDSPRFVRLRPFPVLQTRLSDAGSAIFRSRKLGSAPVKIIGVKVSQERLIIAIELTAFGSVRSQNAGLTLLSGNSLPLCFSREGNRTVFRPSSRVVQASAFVGAHF
jgi:hypothetical protein